MQLRSIDFTWMIAVWVAACGGDKMVDGTTDAGTTDETTTDDTIGVSSAPTTGEAPASTSTGIEATEGSSATGAGATSDVTTGEITTGEVTTGGPTGPDMALCQQFCDKGHECGLPTLDEPCRATCMAKLDVPEPNCDEAMTAVFQCFADLPCAQYEPLINEGDPGPCGGIVDQQEFVCGLDGCDAGGGIDEDGGCSFEKSCRGEPLRRMACDMTSCTCFVADEPFATCPVEDACEDPFLTAKRAEACCDF